MKKIYHGDHNDQSSIWEILVEGKKIISFKKEDYYEIFARDEKYELKNPPKIEMENSSSNGMTNGKLTFGNKFEFNFQIYTQEAPYKYLGKEQILLYPQVIIKKVWPTTGE